ncbi:hypothetical protein PAHAL_6G261800 [Panicum hallii]|uniref:Uncharacterized protein n=1 Tax=Panicum hallii TaxID=206008 RepID=A0A2S3I3Z7_9POAL|nr:uncharacterized protein LOC112898617 [Panicum hallii]PAN36230.1 hypothetical protein PAHAL_6G261800 [Panicum hallii]
MGGVTYQRLLSSGSQRPGVRARAWVLLRWAAVRLGCAARRRYWCGARARRLAWAGLCGRASASAPERRGRRSSAVAAAGVVVGYDSASYARNFDDGAWKAEEGVSWAGPGGAFSRASASAVIATGDSLPSSTS